MQYTKLGNSELTVSRICMGCMGFGDASNGQHSWTVDEAQSREIIHRGMELGINFFDTAMGYQNGTSEEYLGRAIRSMARREDVVVATKFIPRSNAEIGQGISGQEHIQKCLDASLKRLGMDYVDLYIYHMWDYQTPLYDIMEGLDRVVKAGKARYIGISNCFAWQLAKANALAEREGFAKFVSVQGHYNLIFQEDSYARFKYDATAAQDQIIIDRVAGIADRRGVSMTEVALAWLLGKVTAPVVGATKLQHIEGAAKAVELALTEDEIAWLEEPYVPHALVGVMAQNTPQAARETHVWQTGDKS